MKVAVLMGSASDKAKMAPALEMLEQLGVEAVEEVMSAHRTPDVVASFAAEAKDMGFGVIICGAGMAAHLAGAVAARTTLPVIGVPLSGSALGGPGCSLRHCADAEGFPGGDGGHRRGGQRGPAGGGDPRPSRPGRGGTAGGLSRRLRPPLSHSSPG